MSKTITITQITTTDYLGTQDGDTYTIYPKDTDCECDPEFKCSNCSGKFVDKH